MQEYQFLCLPWSGFGFIFVPVYPGLTPDELRDIQNVVEKTIASIIRNIWQGNRIIVFSPAVVQLTFGKATGKRIM